MPTTIYDNDTVPVFTETVLRDKFYESDKCHLCGSQIIGDDAQVIERQVGYYAPRFYVKSNIETYYIRKHFIGHK